MRKSSTISINAPAYALRRQPRHRNGTQLAPLTLNHTRTHTRASNTVMEKKKNSHVNSPRSVPIWRSIDPVRRNAVHVRISVSPENKKLRRKCRTETRYLRKTHAPRP